MQDRRAGSPRKTLGPTKLPDPLDFGIHTKGLKRFRVVLCLHLETQNLGGALGVNHHLRAGAGKVPAHIGVGLGPACAGFPGGLQGLECGADFLGACKAQSGGVELQKHPANSILGDRLGQQMSKIGRPEGNLCLAEVEAALHRTVGNGALEANTQEIVVTLQARTLADQNQEGHKGRGHRHKAKAGDPKYKSNLGFLCHAHSRSFRREI